MGLTLLYSLLDAVKSKNSGLKTWFGIYGGNILVSNLK